MKYHYDLSGSEIILRDEVVMGTADIQRGAAVAREGAITTAENRMGVQAATATDCIGVVGVADEFYDYSAHASGIARDGSNGATAAATGKSNYIKVIINPMAVWTTEWSQHADSDDVNTAASSTGKVITDTIVTDMEGDWAYITDEASSTGGAGNLFMIGASTSTTSVTACTDYDNSLKANAANDTYIRIIGAWNSGDTAAEVADLSAATGEVGTKIFSKISSPGTGYMIVMGNYITDKSTPMEPLRVQRHSGRNYDAATCKLYADVFFNRHILLDGGTPGCPTIA